MDWGKAKTILIIAFVITNIFLIYNIEKNIFESNESFIINDEMIQDVIDILEEKNIKVETEVPKKILMLPALEVEYETYKEDELKELFADEYDNADINSVDHKIIRYEKNNSHSYEDRFDKKWARDEAEKFIKKYGFMKEDAVYWETKRDEEKYHISFRQTYKNRFLACSYMDITVGKSGVEKFERMWLKPLREDGNKKIIIAATKALLKSMNDIVSVEGEEVVIKDIELGYWFDPSYMSFTNPKNIKTGTAVPTWRILFNNGEEKYVIAHENY